MDDQKVENLLKPDKKKIIIGISCMVLAIVICFFGILCGEKIDDAQSYYDLAIASEDKEGMPAYIYLDGAYQFATETDSNGRVYDYYYAFDVNDGLYIIRMDETKIEEIDEIFQKDPDNFSYKLNGFLLNVDDELKEFATDALQEVFELDYYVNVDEFDDYFLSTYLDTVDYDSKIASSYVIFGTFALIIFILGLISFVKYIKEVTIINKRKNSPEFEEEMKQLNYGTHDYDNNDIVMTNDYLINKYENFNAINYKNIIFAYPRALTIKKNVKFTVVICSMKTSDDYGLFNSKDEAMEVVSLLQQRNPEIIGGYNKENIKKYNDIKKGIK